jgi:hypothetical protein
MSVMERAEWLRWWRERGEAELRDLLYDEWNPIGFPGLIPRDEYDIYLGPLVQRLQEGASAEEVADHLSGLRARIVATDNREADLRVAAMLHDWYRTSTSS